MELNNNELSWVIYDFKEYRSQHTQFNLVLSVSIKAPIIRDNLISHIYKL